jgi:hypothetical protein
MSYSKPGIVPIENGPSDADDLDRAGDAGDIDRDG